MTARRAPLRLGGLAVRDLERAQPPRFPAAAVQLQRHRPPRRGSTAASTRPATRGCRRRASPTRGCCSAKPRRWLRIGEELCAQRRFARAAARRGAAGLPARSAVPELALPQDRARAGSCRWSATPTTPTRSRCRRATTRPDADDVTIGALVAARQARSTSRRAARAIPRGLPIYLTEFGVQSYPNKQLGVPVGRQAEYDAMAEADRLQQPARGGLLAVPARATTPSAGAPGSSVHGGTRRLPDGPRVRKRRAEAAVLRLAGAADGRRKRARRTRCGASCARRRRHDADGAGAAEARAAATARCARSRPTARATGASASSGAGQSGGCAGRARRASLRRPADPRALATGAARPSTRRRLASARSYDEAECPSCPRSRSPRACSMARSRARRSSRRSRPASTP